MKCPYCYRPLNPNKWTHDPLLIPNGSKYKWSDKEETILIEESDVIKQCLLKAINRKYDKIIIDDPIVFEKCKKFYKKYEKDSDIKIELYQDKKNPLYEKFDLESDLDKILKRKVWLNCGGYLFFDKTEAMFTIDVNSGKSYQNTITKNVEESLVRINLAAAEEIAKQLRLRNIGGLIVCDFIDMRFRKNQKRILTCLQDYMKDDTAKCTILGMNEFGLLEMTRQRHKQSIAQMMLSTCPYCNGIGQIKTNETVSIEIERRMNKLINSGFYHELKLLVHPYIMTYLHTIGDTSFLIEICKKCNVTLEIGYRSNFHLNQFEFFSNGKKV